MVKKKENKFKRLVIFSVLVMFFITVIQFSVVSTKYIDNDQPEKPRCIFKKADNIQPQKIYKNLKSEINPVLGTDSLLYGGFEESVVQNPSITDNNGQNLFVGFEFWPDWITLPDPYFRYSTDGGTTWLPEDSAVGWALSDTDYFSKLPVIDFSGGNSGFGSMLPDGQNNWVTFNFPDITNPESEDEWIANGWLADVMMSEWHSVDVCGVNSEYTPSVDAYGLAIWTGNTVDGLQNGLWYGWELTAGEEFVVYPDEGETEFDFEADQGTNDIDLSTGMYYQGFYRFNDESPEQYPDGVFLRGVELDGTDQWVDSWETLTHIPGATNPDIKAGNGNCYLVYEINGGIECHYSNDNGNSFNNIQIVDNGQFPSVSALNDKVFVVYSRNGNIYNSISEDGGATWMESASPVNDISGSAIEQIHCVDVSTSNIAWTDNRDAQNSVYFDKAEIATPIISIESVTGGFGLTAVVKNVGNADANNIEWSITFEGGKFFGGDNNGVIDTLSPDQTIEISSKFLLGLGSTEITIDVGGIIETKTASILLFLITGL